MKDLYRSKLLSLIWFLGSFQCCAISKSLLPHWHTCSQSLANLCSPKCLSCQNSSWLSCEHELKKKIWSWSQIWCFNFFNSTTSAATITTTTTTAHHNSGRQILASAKHSKIKLNFVLPVHCHPITNTTCTQLATLTLIFLKHYYLAVLDQR